jgi:multidrug efflux system membrane fusion protein
VRTSALCLGSMACAGLLVLSAGCNSRAAQPVENKRPAAPVVLAEASRKDVPVQITAIGYGTPYLTVSVLARVTGQLVKVGFQQGADVEDGDLLFVIDPRPYQDAVAQAEATLAKDKAAQQQAEATAARDRATAVNARSQQKRYTDLYQQGIVSREQYDQYKSTGDAAEEAVRADEANIAVAKEAVKLDQVMLSNARLQLSYTEIRAPISGRTGNLNVQLGNMVRETGTTPLVVINKISPIYVTFSVPESNLAEIRRYSAAGKLRVTAAPPQAGGPPETGVLDFIDNTVDTATGTIGLKGLFPNPAHRLWPGQFLNVVLDLTVDRGAVVVPSAAVQTGQNGKYVYVVDSNLVAHERAVEVGPSVGSDTVIRSGVAAGERVVTDGQLGVVNGALVQPVGQMGTVQQALAP